MSESDSSEKRGPFPGDIVLMDDQIFLVKPNKFLQIAKVYYSGAAIPFSKNTYHNFDELFLKVSYSCDEFLAYEFKKLIFEKYNKDYKFLPRQYRYLTSAEVQELFIQICDYIDTFLCNTLLIDNVIRTKWTLEQSLQHSLILISAIHDHCLLEIQRRTKCQPLTVQMDA